MGGRAAMRVSGNHWPMGTANLTHPERRPDRGCRLLYRLNVGRWSHGPHPSCVQTHFDVVSCKTGGTSWEELQVTMLSLLPQ